MAKFSTYKIINEDNKSYTYLDEEVLRKIIKMMKVRNNALYVELVNKYERLENESIKYLKL